MEYLFIYLVLDSVDWNTCLGLYEKLVIPWTQYTMSLCPDAGLAR